MKLTIEEGGATMMLRAETPAELDFLLQMEGMHERGPWHDAEFIKVSIKDLGFDPLDCGKQWLPKFHTDYGDVMAVVRLKLTWLSYAEPKTPEQRLRANAAACIGHSLLDGFELVGRHP